MPFADVLGFTSAAPGTSTPHGTTPERPWSWSGRSSEAPSHSGKEGEGSHSFAPPWAEPSRMEIFHSAGTLEPPQGQAHPRGTSWVRAAAQFCAQPVLFSIPIPRGPKLLGVSLCITALTLSASQAWVMVPLHQHDQEQALKMHILGTELQ